MVHSKGKICLKRDDVGVLLVRDQEGSAVVVNWYFGPKILEDRKLFCSTRIVGACLVK